MLQVIANTVCAQTYGTTFVVASTICTSGEGGRGTCGGDSGGPVVFTNDSDRILVMIDKIC